MLDSVKEKFVFLDRIEIFKDNKTLNLVNSGNILIF